MKVYQLNLKGFAPFYTTDKKEALEKYTYLKHFCTSCSLRKIDYCRMLAKIFKTV